MNKTDKINDIAELEQAAFSSPWTREMIQQSMMSELDRVEVMEKQGVFQGYIIYSVVCDSADLLRIAVKPEFRRCGVGRWLMQKMLDTCIEEKVQNIFLEVRQSNNSAVSMYKSFGFTEISRRKNYYKSPMEDGIVMQRTIEM